MGQEVGHYQSIIIDDFSNAPPVSPCKDYSIERRIAVLEKAVRVLSEKLADILEMLDEQDTLDE